MSTKLPTYGYRKGEAKIFDLEPGEALPDGWADAPVADDGGETAPPEALLEEAPPEPEAPKRPPGRPRKPDPLP